MTISGVLTSAGRAALAKGLVGTVSGSTIRNVLKYFVFGEGGAQIAAVTGEVVAVANGSVASFSGTIANLPIKRGSLQVVAGAVVAADDGNGVLDGVGVSGTVNYKSGAFTLEYNAAPSAGNITADYQYRSVPAVPLASRVATVAELTPLDATNPAHLAWFKKEFGSDLTAVVTYQALPSSRTVATMFLALDEFIDDGRGDPPVLSEVGIYDTEDQLIAYGTFDKETKNGASTVSHTCTFVW